MSFRPFAPACAFRPFGAGSPGVFLGTPVDVLLLFGTGTPGNIITAPNLDSATIGALPGTWAVEPVPLTHTKYQANTDVRRTLLRIAGQAYDGSENSLGIFFDLAEAVVNEDTYDLAYWTPPAGPTITDLSVTALMRFNAIGSASQDIAMDHIMISAGRFAILQQRITQTQFGLDPLSAGTISSHGQLSGGSSTFGPTISIQPDVLYSVTLRSKKYDGVGFSEVIVLNGTTGALVGVSACRSDMGSVTRVTVQDYLSFGGGSNRYKLIGMDWTNAAFPVEPMTVPVPSGFEAELVDANTAHLIWDSLGTSFRVEREVDGVWSTLIDTPDSEYVDETFSDGMRYRVVTTIDTLESAPTSALAPTNSISLGFYRTPFSGATEGSSNWPDALGAYDLSNPSAQPLYVSGVLNGYPVMRFTGTQRLGFGGASSSDFPRTILTVIRRTGGTGHTSPVASDLATGGLEFELYAEPGVSFMIVNKQGVATLGDFSAEITADWHVLAAVVTSDEVLFYEDGVLINTFSHGQTLSPDCKFVLGCRSPGDLNDRHFVGDIAFLRIFGREVLGPEIASRSAALIAKYGL